MDSENKIRPEVEAKVTTSEKRRKLIRGALIGAPVLLALKSTPVLACNCKLPSGFSTSGNLSHKLPPCTVPAPTPSYWKNNYHHTTKKFNGTSVKTTDFFNSVFAPGDPSNRNFLAVLQSGNSDFTALIAAAYLGVLSGKFVVGVTQADIKKMWNGTYKPLGSINFWTRQECQEYLMYVMR